MSGAPLAIGRDAPFPWFGGKRRVAEIVWRALGDCPGYVEPFAGSLAVLLRRPGEPGTETVNDRDGFIANFWRAVQRAPDEVASYADNPVNETDLFARHLWLVNDGRARLGALEADPEYFDARVAGWWVWGICCWIGSGWCSGDGPWTRAAAGGPGINRKLPHLGDPGRGVNRQLPHLGDPGRGFVRTEALRAWMRALAARLQRVRVAGGDWSRVVTPSVLRGGGWPCGVFLDPPYEAGGENYSTSAEGVARAAAAWAVANGGDPNLRIILCGYADEVEMPPDWYCHAYSATGAYIGRSDSAAGEGRHRERIWFSPACLPVDLQHAALRGDSQAGLFDAPATSFRRGYDHKAGGWTLEVHPEGESAGEGEP